MTRENDNDRHGQLMRAAAEILNSRLKSGSTRAQRTMPQQHEAAEPEASSSAHRSVSVSNLPPPPSRLYKYLLREHAESLVQRGATRVGTLRDFRNEERYGKGIGDATEGTKTIRAVLNGTIDGGTQKATALSRLGKIVIADAARGTKFVNFTSVSKHMQPDALVWCCSTERSADALAAIDGADTCVEIFDVTGFFGALDRAVLAHFSSYSGLEKFGPAPVSYQSRIEAWNERDLGLNPVFIKEDIPIFAAQREVRAAWFNQTSPELTFKADVLPSSDCHQFCRIVDPADAE